MKAKGKIILAGIAVLILALANVIFAEPIGRKQCPDSQIIKKYVKTSGQGQKHIQVVSCLC